MNFTNRAEKVEEKYIQLCTVKSATLNYIYPSERSRYALSGNGLVYYEMTVSEISEFEVEEFCWISAESEPFWYFNR